jgi:hypothetical protein
MSSLIITQQLKNFDLEASQLQDSLREADANLAQDPSRRNRKARQDIIDRLADIRRSLRILTEQEAAMPKPAPRPQTPPPQEVKNTGPSDQTLACGDCSNDFTFTAKEQNIHSRNGWDAPKRCPECRAAKKAARPKDMDITCSDCGTNFIFTVTQQNNFRHNNWDQPKRCVDCAAAKKARQPKPILINCKTCHADFTFSIGAQKHFKEMKWNNPTHCSGCRKKKHNHSDNASKASSNQNTNTNINTNTNTH